MGRGSRHKSHRSHKPRDRSDSEEDVHSRERRPTVEAEEDDPRDSRVSETAKRRSSLGNGDLSGENSRKRKDRGEDAAAADRWNGRDDDDRDDKVVIKDGIDTEKSLKSKVVDVDFKGKSCSRRREGSSERYEEKRRSEKESSQRESASSDQYKDGRGKEREREREREQENNKKVQNSRNEGGVDGWSRKEERTVNKDTVISELQDEMRNPELEKGLEKHMKRRRDGSGDNNKLRDDGKETDARCISAKDEHSKNGSYEDNRYKEERYKEKYRHDLDKDQRQRDDRRRDEHSSRIRTSDRFDNKYSRDEDRLPESRNKTKSKNIDHDGKPFVEDRKTELKDKRGRKRSSDETEDSSDVKRRNTKESLDDTQRNGSRSDKVDSHTDRAREQLHPDNVDSGLSNSHPKNYPGSSAYAVKDQTRHNSRQPEFFSRDPLSEEIQHPRITSRAEHHDTSDGRERVSESRSMEKTKLKDDTRSDVLVSEASAASRLRSDVHSSPNHLTSDQRLERSGARRVMDEVGKRSSNCKDGRSSKDVGRDWDLPMDKPKGSGNSRMNLLNCDPTSPGPSSYNQTANLRGNSPGHLAPPPPRRLRVDSPSVLGSYEDENRNHNADRKTNNRCERSGDVSAGRGPGTPWKGAPTWSSAANGFTPLQHGSGGFHPAVQFPAPPLYGVRPLMGSYHPHEANRFSGHPRPYDCPPHVQPWDGSKNMFTDESHFYGRPDWDQNRHVMGNRGWDFNVDMWNGQNGSVNMEFPVPRNEQEYSTQTSADETWAGKSGDCSHVVQVDTELPTTDSGVINKPMDASTAMNATRTLKALHEKISETSNMPTVQKTSQNRSDNYVTFCCNYLSKLDISPNLVQLELYEKYVSLVGARDGVVAANVIVQGHQKSSRSQDARVAAKSKKHFLSSRSPALTDDVFQRAMSLYEWQKTTVKESMNPGLRMASSEEERVPSAPDVAKVNADSPNNRVDDLTMTGAIPSSPAEVENKTSIDAERDVPEDDVEAKHDDPSDAEEKQCGNISESVVLAEDSEDCQALMPECSVNLSRIHLSLKSTH